MKVQMNNYISGDSKMSGNHDHVESYVQVMSVKRIHIKSEECAMSHRHDGQRHVSKTRYGRSFWRVQYSFHNPTAITPTATATAKPPKNDPTSKFRCDPVVVVVSDGVAVETLASVGRQHTTDKLRVTCRR